MLSSTTTSIASLLQRCLSELLWSAGLGLLCIAIWYRSQKSDFSTINAYDWDLTGRKAREAYISSAKALLASGTAKVGGVGVCCTALISHGSQHQFAGQPFRIITAQGSRIILPPSYTDWAKSCPDLDHQALVHDDFFASYPGFDGQAVVTNPDRILIDVTRTKLSQNAQSIQAMNQQVREVLSSVWTENTGWHTLNWPEDTMSVISRMSAAVFVGPELASDPEWQDLTITYTVNVFKACAALRQWPGFLRPTVHRFLPQAKICQEQVRRTRKKLQVILDQRGYARAKAHAEHNPPIKHEDTITWFEEIAAGRPYDPAASQLALAISALHTTSEAFRQVLLDLCLHPDLLDPIREEMTAAIAESGWSSAALAKMQLVDSVMKESQRFKSAIVGIERKVIRATTLPGGPKVPRGSIICVNASDMWSNAVHDDPQIFDGYRFLRMRQLGGRELSVAPFVSSTREHNTFGAGKFICPGRFFVANEMKIALAHVLLKYEMRLKDGCVPRDLITGFYPSTDLEVQVEVRRRDYENNIEL